MSSSCARASSSPTDRKSTVKDVVASFQRIFKVSTPTAGSFYNGIVGADACLKTPATCTLDGGVVADEANNTVTINLVAPDAEFFDKLAVPHGVILPADTPDKDMGNTPIPGTGALHVRRLRSQQAARRRCAIPTSRSGARTPSPTAIRTKSTMISASPGKAQITAIENGQADWTLDQPPADRLAEMGTKYPSQVHINTLTAMWYAPMNVNIPPFNNLKARLAVNYAIDRNAMVKLFGGKVLAQPACQILPPGFPGYEPYCPYTKHPGTKWSAPDLAKAKRLVKESGTAGQKVTIIVQDLTADKSEGTYLQSVLKSIGYDASVKALSQNIQFTYIQNTNNKVQISVTQWYQDYPAPSDFLNVLLGCNTFHPGSDNSPNIAGLLRQGHPGQDGSRPGYRHDRSGRGRQGVGANRQADDRPGAGRRRCSRRSTSTSCRSGSGTTSSTPSTTGCTTWPGCNSERPGTGWTKASSPQCTTMSDSLPATTELGEGLAAMVPRPALGPWARAARKLVANRAAMGALGLFILIVLACLAAPLYADLCRPYRSLQLQHRRHHHHRRPGRGAGAALDRGPGVGFHSPRPDLGHPELLSSAPTRKAETSPRACCTAGAIRSSSRALRRSSVSSWRR